MRHDVKEQLLRPWWLRSLKRKGYQDITPSSLWADIMERMGIPPRPPPEQEMGRVHQEEPIRRPD